MNRPREAALILGSAVLAALGVAFVNAAAADALDAQVGLTFVVFGGAFGTLSYAAGRWADGSPEYLLPTAALLTAVGFTEIYRLNPEQAALQRWWLLIAAATAVAALWAVSRVRLRTLARYQWTALAAAIGLLLLPLLPSSWPLGGAEINGSRLWLQLKLFGDVVVQFQPAEFAKLLLVVFLASYLADRQASLSEMPRRLGPLALPEPRQLVPLAAAWAASLLILVYQRDLGASLLLFAVFVVVAYAATGRLAYVVSGLSLFSLGAVFAFRAFDHVQRRVDAWIDPFEDFADTGYQVSQSLFALGSGSLTGSGLGLGRPDFIPSATTDFLFSAIAEELGLAGSIAVIAAYALLVGVGFGISVRARDPFRKLLAAGLSSVIAIQAILILGGVTRLLPITGVALPFLSYGGSSLVANTVILTMLLRVASESSS